MIRTFRDYETHQPVLIEVLKRTAGAVLELGAGDYSTPVIHGFSANRKVLTIDDSERWLNKYLNLKTANHDFLFVSHDDSQKYYDADNKKWNVVFVDNGNWDTRILAINKYKDVVDYMIIHDCTYISGNQLMGTISNGNQRNYDSIFKYWTEYFVKYSTPNNPPTLLGSNKMSLKDIVIEDMVIMNASKI